MCSFPGRAELDCRADPGSDLLRGLQGDQAGSGAARVVRRLLRAVPRYPTHPERPKRREQRGSSHGRSEFYLVLL